MKRIVKKLNMATIVICVVTILGLFISMCKANEFEREKTIIKAILALVLLVPILVCHLANNKLETVYCKKRIIFMAIITLLFGNIISGILMLSMNEME